VIIDAGAITMRTILISTGTLCLLGAGFAAALAQPAAPNQRACVQIRAACQTAGFVAGGARIGNPTTYEAIRGPTYLYVEYADGNKEYHDLAAADRATRSATRN
jgi:hypothetical protein